MVTFGQWKLWLCFEIIMCSCRLLSNITLCNFWRNDSIKSLFFPWNLYLKKDGKSLLILFFVKDPKQHSMKIIWNDSMKNIGETDVRNSDFVISLWVSTWIVDARKLHQFSHTTGNVSIVSDKSNGQLNKISISCGINLSSH